VKDLSTNYTNFTKKN